jgi:murein DD-endopeptidase MepM/ murein hydrolase activator NlpD
MGFLAKAEKSRIKMQILSLNGKIFLWVMLFASLSLFLAGEGFLPVVAKAAAPKNASLESGVGGGVNPEIFIPSEIDLEIEGLPEPEEFSRPHLLTFSSYTIEKGDMIGNIAKMTGLNSDTIISVNNIKNTRLIQIGLVLKIPNQDGIYYSVKTGDTLESIAEKYETTALHISTANELFSDTLTPNISLFVPGGKLDWINRQEINGDLFIWPVSGYVSSAYGYRIAPFAGTRQFHSGIDIAAPMGSPLKAAMSGRVSQVGYDDSFGNYLVITHHSGYRTFYGHMSVVRVKAGAYVATGERIGDIGSTGLSTGPHVHFTVYKNGVTVNPRSLMR